MTSTYDYLCSNPTIVRGGFVKPGIIEALEEQLKDEDTDGRPFQRP